MIAIAAVILEKKKKIRKNRVLVHHWAVIMDLINKTNINMQIWTIVVMINNSMMPYNRGTLVVNLEVV